MIEQFTRQEFESILPVDVKHRIDKGEICYLIPIDNQVGVYIRSGINPYTERARGTGKDSIRFFLVTYFTKIGGFEIRLLGAKLSGIYVQRVPGWRVRVQQKILELQQMYKISGKCPVCNRPREIWKVKKEGANKGKLFAKCQEHNQFVWLD